MQRRLTRRQTHNRHGAGAEAPRRTAEQHPARAAGNGGNGCCSTRQNPGERQHGRERISRMTRRRGRITTRHGGRSHASARARNIGFILAAHDPYTGIDLDHCYRAGRHALQLGARRPGGGPWAGVCRKVAIRHGDSRHPARHAARRVSWNSGPHAGHRSYQTGRYLTMTGNVLAGSVAVLAPAQHALDAILWVVFPSAQHPARQHANLHAEQRRARPVMARRRCGATWTTSHGD